jgi:hypothetical protein
MSLILDGSNGLSDVDGSAATPAIRGTDTNTGIFFPAADTIAFSEGGVEAMRIDSTGTLLVGTTAQRGTSVISTGALGVGIGSGTAAQGYRQIYFDQATGILYFSNGLNQASLTLAGAWTNASDGRLKNTIVDIQYGLDAVMATQPRSYKMNDMEGNYIGFVAQELQEVIPEVVSGNAETQLGVDYGSLVAVAFKAIQELKTELDTVKAELATLKA